MTMTNLPHVYTWPAVLSATQCQSLAAISVKVTGTSLLLPTRQRDAPLAQEDVRAPRHDHATRTIRECRSRMASVAT
jgi:hypothetical protein